MFSNASFTPNKLLPTVLSNRQKLGASPIAFNSPIGQSEANYLKINLGVNEP